MTKQEKVSFIVRSTHISKEVAFNYLEAEEWVVIDAIDSIKADLKGGMLCK